MFESCTGRRPSILQRVDACEAHRAANGSENRSRREGGSGRGRQRRQSQSCGLLKSLAVIARRGGHWRTKANLNGRLRTTPRGFEDRGSVVRCSPTPFANDGKYLSQIRGHQSSSAAIRPLGCRLGCHITLDDLEELGRFRRQIAAIARRRGIGEVLVFGSVARGDARPDSDVDFLVQVEPGRSILAVGGFLDEVSELIGKPVHVVTRQSLSGAESQRALSEAVPL
jgi:predicted nucleotidyltransferase